MSSPEESEAMARMDGEASEDVHPMMRGLDEDEMDTSEDYWAGTKMALGAIAGSDADETGHSVATDDLSEPGHVEPGHPVKPDYVPEPEVVLVDGDHDMASPASHVERPQTPATEPPGAPERHPPGRCAIAREHAMSSLGHAQREDSPTLRRDLRPKRRPAPGHPQDPASLESARPRGRSHRQKKELSNKAETHWRQRSRREYEVDRILDTRVEKGTLVQYYLVKWKGYGSSANTWEPKQNLANCPQAIDVFERAAGRKGAHREKGHVLQKGKGARSCA